MSWSDLPSELQKQIAVSNSSAKCRVKLWNQFRCLSKEHHERFNLISYAMYFQTQIGPDPVGVWRQQFILPTDVTEKNTRWRFSPRSVKIGTVTHWAANFPLRVVASTYAVTGLGISIHLSHWVHGGCLSIAGTVNADAATEVVVHYSFSDPFISVTAKRVSSLEARRKRLDERWAVEGPAIRRLDKWMYIFRLFCIPLLCFGLYSIYNVARAMMSGFIFMEGVSDPVRWLGVGGCLVLLAMFEGTDNPFPYNLQKWSNHGYLAEGELRHFRLKPNWGPHGGKRWWHQLPEYRQTKLERELMYLHERELDQ